MKSADIWTQEDLSSSHEVIDSLTVWRFVEAQNVIATTPLVESWYDQSILEDILEESKPPLPDNVKGLDFLLSTPFRYRSVAGATSTDKGSRFRRAGIPDGVFYAAGHPHTGAYEAGFYRALFWHEASGMKPPTGGMPFTAFSTTISTAKALNLTTHPVLSKYEKFWEDPSDYDMCQKLAAAARQAGVEVIIYRSVRDPSGRLNYAVLTPDAFFSRRVEDRQSWSFLYSSSAVFMACECPSTRLQLTLSDLQRDPRFC